MAMPSQESSIWKEIIKGNASISFEFFAVKIFLGSAQVFYKKDPASLSKLSKELFNLFEKNQNLPSAKRDLEKILSLGEKS